MKKIAFIQPSPSWHASVSSVRTVLAAKFPQHEIDVINVLNLLKDHKLALLLNGALTAREYGIEMVSRKHSFAQYFLHTPYIFDHIRTILARRLERGEYAFSFQIYSLYDGSSSNLPHFVYTDHTHLANLTYPDFDSSALYSSRWIAREKTIYSNATLNFVKSQHVMQSLIAQYDCPPNKLALVRGGGNARANARAVAHDDDYSNKRILFVGYDWERKGGPELVEAFKLVLRAHPDARLTIVGCAPPVNVPNCVVVGRVPLDELDEYYRQATIFCLPTKREPFGTVQLEAYMRRLPVVATSIGSAPDFVRSGENGYLVPSGSVEDLAHALIYLLDSPERCRAFGEAGYNLVSTMYTWDRVGEEIRKHILEYVPGC